MLADWWTVWLLLTAGCVLRGSSLAIGSGVESEYFESLGKRAAGLVLP